MTTFITPIQMKHGAQRGSTTLGIIVGVVLGLAVALGVSLYIAYSGAPIQTKAANTAARIEPPADPSKAPDPNQSLYTKVPKTDDTKASETSEAKDSKVAKVPKDAVTEAKTEAKPADAIAAPSATAPIAAPASKSAELDGIGKIAAIVTPVKPNPALAAPVAATSVASAKTTVDPIAAMPKAATAAAGERYFVQAGAFANPAEAESMKAKLALQGVSMTLSPRDKDGQILQRVRTAPLAAVDAERLRNTLKANGIETSLVKVQ